MTMTRSLVNALMQPGTQTSPRLPACSPPRPAFWKLLFPVDHQLCSFLHPTMQGPPQSNCAGAGEVELGWALSGLRKERG